MSLLEIISISSIISWLFPPFRQYKSPIFYYFLVLGIMDPITLGFALLFQIPFVYLYLILSFILLFTIKRLTVNQYVIITIMIISVSIILFLTSTAETINMFIAFQHTIILLIFLKIAVIKSSSEKTIDLFYFMLVLYEITIVLKIVSRAFNMNIGAYYFNLVTFVEIIIAIFFTLFREDSPKLKLRIKSV